MQNITFFNPIQIKSGQYPGALPYIYKALSLKQALSEPFPATKKEFAAPIKLNRLSNI